MLRSRQKIEEPWGFCSEAGSCVRKSSAFFREESGRSSEAVKKRKKEEEEAKMSEVAQEDSGR